MPFSTYAELTTAIGTWEERTLTSAETDEAIALAEAEANLKLGSTYRRVTTATINTDANGEGTLPTGFVRMRLLVRDVTGSMPLKQVSWNAIIQHNPYRVSSDAGVYAIRGTAIKLAPVTDDNFLATYEATLTALSSGNTTNWLLTLLPNFYLFMCQSMICMKYRDYQSAGLLKSEALSLLDPLIAQGNVAEFGDAEMTLDMATP